MGSRQGIGYRLPASFRESLAPPPKLRDDSVSGSWAVAQFPCFR